MLHWLTEVLRGDGFMPHGHCYLWRRDVVLLHVTSDALIALAYLAIPLALIRFVRGRRDLPFHWIFLCFGLFIISCGFTHVMEIVTLWRPVYWISGAAKAVTAAASLSTAVILVRLIPLAIALPSPGALREAHDALAQSERRFRAAAEGSLDAFFLFTMERDAGGAVDFRCVDANARGAALVGRSRDALVGASVRDLSTRGARDLARYAAVVEGQTPYEGEEMVPDAPGADRWIYTQVVPLVDGVAVTVRDVTERERTRRALEQVAHERARLAAIVESSRDAILSVTPDGLIASWNDGATRLFEHTAAEMVGQPFGALSPADRAAETEALLARTARGEPLDPIETVRLRRGTLPVEVSMSLSPIHAPDGGVVGTSVIAEEITARKDIERRLKESLAEKVVLLQEVHHRVKNNLQVISSLLSLQGRYLTDARAREVVRDSQQRVRSIALLHESLYQSPDLGRLDVGEYLRRLAASLVRAYGVASTPRLAVETEPVAIDLDAAVPLGLIVNELVTNALKYAFVDRAGPLRITLKPTASGGYCLAVSDDGVGLPPGFDPATAPSLGLHIVRTLAEQLGATLALAPGVGPGTAFEVRVERDATSGHSSPSQP